jgi:hypothetical protein
VGNLITKVESEIGQSIHLQAFAPRRFMNICSISLAETVPNRTVSTAVLALSLEILELMTSSM